MTDDQIINVSCDGGEREWGIDSNNCKKANKK